MVKIYLFIIFAILHVGATISLHTKVVNQTDSIYVEDVKYLAFVTSGDLYSCSCVIIGKRHLLASASCVMRHENNLEIVVGAIPYTDDYYNNHGAQFTVKKVTYDDGYWGKLRHKHINVHNNFAVLSLNEDLPISDKVKIAKLPSDDIKLDEKVTIYGWYHTCRIRSPTRIISVPATIENRRNCDNIQNDEICVKTKSLEKTIRSSPVIKDGTIIGYTAFECPEGNQNPVTNVYKSLLFINRAMEN